VLRLIIEKFKENPHVLSVALEILAYILKNAFTLENLSYFATLALTYAHMEQKELVRSSVAKALAVLFPQLQAASF